MPRPRFFPTTLLVAVFLLLAATARAGEIVFKNGDRLTGEVIQLVDGRLKIKSDVAGEVTVDRAKVNYFTTDQPVEMKFKDGTALRAAVGWSGYGGTFFNGPTTMPTGVNASTTTPTSQQANPNSKSTSLDINDIVTINEPPKNNWTGNIRAGATINRGNTDNEAYNAALDAARRGEKDRLAFNGRYLFGRERNGQGEKNVTTDNWLGQAKYDYFLTKKLYEYNVLKLERDNIAQLNLRAQPGAGFGYQWFEGPKLNFNTEIGAGYTYEDYENQDAKSYANVRAAYHYDRVIRDNVKFINNFEFLPSVEDFEKFNVNADVAVRVTLTPKFFTEGRIEWKYNSDPGPGAQESDFRYILSVGWEF